jgi:hypothetical protein
VSAELAGCVVKAIHQAGCDALHSVKWESQHAVMHLHKTQHFSQVGIKFNQAYSIDQGIPNSTRVTRGPNANFHFKYSLSLNSHSLSLDSHHLPQACHVDFSHETCFAAGSHCLSPSSNSRSRPPLQHFNNTNHTHIGLS